ELEHSRKLGNLRLVRLAPGVAVIDNLSAGAALDVLRKAGYLPVLESSPTAPAGAQPNAPALLPAAGHEPGTEAYIRDLTRLITQATRAGPYLAATWTAAPAPQQLLSPPFSPPHGALACVRVPSAPRALT